MDHTLAHEAAAETATDFTEFVRVVDEAVAFANWGANELKSPKAANLAALYGVARFGAFVGRGTSGDEREAYIKAMADRYAAMLRAHFGDDALVATPGA